ncbi:MAG: hypothetical protein F4Y99_12660 [Acidimicrobiaceae bacterium]|nr:hypothetical protein [Acidimicrobiaceae bacterium]MYF43083.1 hypothetical protein [Acidimicrobiaceae bacterium]
MRQLLLEFVDHFGVHSSLRLRFSSRQREFGLSRLGGRGFGLRLSRGLSGSLGLSGGFGFSGCLGGGFRFCLGRCLCGGGFGGLSRSRVGLGMGLLKSGLILGAGVDALIPGTRVGITAAGGGRQGDGEEHCENSGGERHLHRSG